MSGRDRRGPGREPRQPAGSGRLRGAGPSAGAQTGSSQGRDRAQKPKEPALGSGGRRTGGPVVGGGDSRSTDRNPQRTSGGGERGQGSKAPAGVGSAAAKRFTSRDVALNTLVKVAEAGAYSNLQLNRALQDAQLTRQDAALATELVYGTIQRQRTLDYRLAALVSKGLDKLAPWVHQLLRLSAYQLLYLDRIPAHAAVNEAVQIAKRRGHAGISGMVNGVLRNMHRRLNELKAPVVERDPVRRIGISHSYPDWLVRRWVSQFGEAAAEAICAAGNEPPHASLRVNRLRMTRQQAIAALAEAGIEAAESPVASFGVIATAAGSLAQTDGFRSGLWTLQDESSMLVAEVCAPQSGMLVLDCCAAPGGKSTHLAELMDDKGRVVANDVHEHKRRLIEDNAHRLHLASVEAVVGDAAELSMRYEPASFDLVLLDAPCTGFGVIRRKPEIKWTKSEEDIRSIAALQSRLLDEAAKLVKPGGALVYSTCTIEREENEAQVRAFLERNGEFGSDPAWPEQVLGALRDKGAIGPDFDGMAQLLPYHFGSDGFFIARMKRQL